MEKRRLPDIPVSPSQVRREASPPTAYGAGRSPAQIRQRLRGHWNRNLALTGSLLAVWFLVSFGLSWFARQLSAIHFFGWPLSFYMAAQGSLIVYLILIGWYAVRMRKHDQASGWGEESGS